MVSVNAACCTGLPHAADVVMGTLATRPRWPADLPSDVAVRRVQERDLAAVLAIYAEGLATRNATFETVVPGADELRARWLPDLAWVAEIDDAVVGWTAVTPGLRPRLLLRRRRDLGLRRRGRSRTRGRHHAAPRAGLRGRCRRDVDPADLDLPREPRQPGPAPLRGVPHAGGPQPYRPARRPVA